MCYAQETLLSPAMYRDPHWYKAKPGGECGIIVCKVRWTAMINATRFAGQHHMHRPHALTSITQNIFTWDTPVAGSVWRHASVGSVGGAEICIDLDVLSSPEWAISLRQPPEPPQLRPAPGLGTAFVTKTVIYCYLQSWDWVVARVYIYCM